MRRARTPIALLSGLLLLGLGLFPSGCSEPDPTAGASLSLRDPLQVLNDIVGDLNLLVLPSGTYSCDPATGLVSGPAGLLPEDQMLMLPDAVVDISVAVGMAAQVMVESGSYVVAVRGRGTDIVTNQTNVLIGAGCSTEAIDPGETREITVELKMVFRSSVCGDGTVSPDEQCDDGAMAPGDGCSETCRTEPFTVVRRFMMEPAGETLPAAVWGSGSRLFVVYDSDAAGVREVAGMMLQEDGSFFGNEQPALEIDRTVEEIPAVQTLADVASGGGRFAVAFVDFSSGGAGRGDVRVAILNPDRVLAGPSELAADVPGEQTNPAVAVAGDGTVMVVFEDENSATGLSGRIYPAGMISPANDMPFVVGTAGASAPAIAALDAGFIVTYSASGVFHQRFGTDGTPTDAMGVALTAEGGASGPTAVSPAPGGAVAVWQGANGIAGTLIAADGSVGATVPLGTAATNANPSVVADNGRIIVAWQDGTSLFGRLFDDTLMPALNRESPPTSDAFVLAAGAVSRPELVVGGTTDRRWGVVYGDTGTDPAGDIQARYFPLP